MKRSNLSMNRSNLSMMNRSNLSMMNRRGQFPLILLVVITLTLVLIALFSFASFSNEVGKPSKAYADMMSEIDFAELYVIKKADLLAEKTVNCGNCVETDLKKKFMEVAARHDLKYESAGNFFGKIRTGDFKFEERTEIVNDPGLIGTRGTAGPAIPTLGGGMIEVNYYYLEINDLFVKSEKGRNEIVRDFDLTMRFDLSGKMVEKEKVYK